MHESQIIYFTNIRQSVSKLNTAPSSAGVGQVFQRQNIFIEQLWILLLTASNACIPLVIIRLSILLF